MINDIVKIIDYRIASSFTAWELESLVQALIRDGYQPYGGIVAGRSDGQFVQAVVKYQ